MPKVACPSCRTAFKVDASAYGHRARCQKCGKIFRIPVPTIRPTAAPDVLRVSDLENLSHGEAIAKTDPPPTEPPKTAKPGDEPWSADPAFSSSANRVIAADRQASGGLLGLVCDIGNSFVLFARPGNLITFGFAAMIFAIEPFALWGGCIGRLAVIIINGWIMAFQFNVLAEAAAGERDLPNIDITNVLEGIVIPLGKWLAVQIIAFLPLFLAMFYVASIHRSGVIDVVAIASAIVTGDVTSLTGQNAIAAAAVLAPLIGAFLFGMALQPILYLVAAIGGFTALIRLDLMVATIARTLGGYAIVLVVFFGLRLLPGVIEHLATPPPPPATARMPTPDAPMLGFGAQVGINILELFCGIIAMRTAGSYYHHLKARFAWSWG